VILKNCSGKITGKDNTYFPSSKSENRPNDPANPATPLPLLLNRYTGAEPDRTGSTEKIINLF
jgi:hypothetical protein